jgi:membrane associated rhomboid family serine protease
MKIELFLLFVGASAAISGLATFFCYQKNNVRLARIGILMVIAGSALIFWHFLSPQIFGQ